MDNSNLENRLDSLENVINDILKRNQRVELEKAWEQSKLRIFGIVILTYLLMCIVFYLMGSTNYMVNAIVPTLGYYLSTHSL